MSDPFVPDAFVVPTEFAGPGFRLEPLGPEHNQRDYEAWTSSIEHIRSTPGFPDPDDDWPYPMSLDDNMSDMLMHARHFEERRGFTYSILDGDDVIGCVYIYPTRDPDHQAEVSSWVTAARANLDRVVWEALSAWLETWPFDSFAYDSRS
ncbi:MAG: GNAT family N-acetyltransferase [Acidimicrobiia bacterium]|nr:GNAT family N-acetyltransferase [Acidimicrobiia bacterium]